jgi:hypothetical protein
LLTLGWIIYFKKSLATAMRAEAASSGGVFGWTASVSSFSIVASWSRLFASSRSSAASIRSVDCALIAALKDEGADQRRRGHGPRGLFVLHDPGSGEPQQPLRIGEHGLDALARDLLPEQLRQIASVDMLEVRRGTFGPGRSRSAD